MGCLAIFLNLILPGLGTIFLSNKTGQGFAQLFFSVLNLVLIAITFGLWGLLAPAVHLAIFAWALASTFSAISEKTAKKMYREQHQDYL